MPEYKVEQIERSTGERRIRSVLAPSEGEARKRAMCDGWLLGDVQQLRDRGEAGGVQPTSAVWRRLRAGLIVLVPLFVALVALFLGLFISPF